MEILCQNIKLYHANTFVYKVFTMCLQYIYILNINEYY